MVSAVVVAAGSGRRMGGVKKQFLLVGGVAVLLRSVRKLAAAGVDEIVIVSAQEELARVRQLCKDEPLVSAVVAGGDTRQQSVKNGFMACCAGDGLVAIHDAARPFVREEDVRHVLQAAAQTGAAALGVPVVDTIKRVRGGVIIDTPDRAELFAVQTPQVFDKRLYKRALAQALPGCTDDCQLVEALGVRVAMVSGSRRNIKITTPEDLPIAELYAKEENR